MSAKNLTEKLPAFVRARPVLFGAVAVLLVAAVTFLLFRPGSGKANTGAFYQTKRGDFTVSIVEGGTLGAVTEVSIRNEVEGTARIISIVPEGSYVKKGDLLVELDASQAQDQVNQQQINFEKAKFAVEQAEAQLEIMRSATNSDYLSAKLKLELALLEKEKYDKGQKMVSRMEASNQVVQVKSKLEMDFDNYRNSTNLAAKGYETRQRVQSDELSLLGSQISLITANNKLWMLEQFDIKKSTQQLDADIAQAEQELNRTLVQNRRRMAQYQADYETQKNTLLLSEQKLERDKRNLEATKIFAPQDGLVVYQVSENRFSSESLIEGGAVVRNRQELIKLPDLSKLKVVVKVHESHINLIKPGLPAYVVLDSAPDERYAGVVERVAPLPDTQARWGNPNLKVYNTEVHLTRTPPNARPGISAKAEIIITNISDAISVPIQAVTTLKNRQVVYVAKGGQVQPRPVEVGMFNTKFIQIAKGLEGGEFVLLSPPFDAAKDIEGGVLEPDEKAKLAPTNAPAARPSPAMPDETPVIGPVASAGPNPGAPNAMMRRQENGGPQAGQGAPGGFNPEEMLKRFDKNGDGQLDDEERNAMRESLGGQRGAGGPGGFNREEMMKRFDKNGDGQLDEEERNAMRESFGGQRGAGGPGGFNREEMMKRFDKNGDGELDEEERNAMRESFGGGRRGPGQDGSSQPPGEGGRRQRDTSEPRGDRVREQGPTT